MGAENRKKKPAVEVMGSGYQPTKAEMEEAIVVDASPEQLLQAVVHNVEIRIVDLKKR